MINDVVTFSSEKEKESYLAFVNKEYKNNKIGIFRKTYKAIKEQVELYSKYGIPDPLGWVCLLTIVAFFVMLFVSEPPIFLTVLSIISCIEIRAATENAYLGLLPTLLKTPFFFISSIVEKISKKIKHKKYTNEIKKAIVKEESHEDEKNSKEREVGLLINNVRSDYVAGRPLSTVISGLEDAKDEILMIMDSEVFKKRILSLYQIVSLLTRSMKLSRERREEALRFTQQEIYNLRCVIKKDLEQEQKEEIIEPVKAKAL
jgi:hypothetical protein